MSKSLVKRGTSLYMNMMHMTENNLRESLSRSVGAFKLLQESSCALTKLANLSNAFKQSLRSGGKIMICGNGGFAAVSQHVAAELMGKMSVKRNPLPAISLATDTSVMTCIANDFGYEKVFSRQIDGIGYHNDVLLCLSASGQSKNILEALCTSRKKEIPSFLICGIGDHCNAIELGACVIEFPASETDVIQDMAMVVLHNICKMIELEESNGNDNKWPQIINYAKCHNLNSLILDRDGTINELLPNDYVLTKENLKINAGFLKSSQSLASYFQHIFLVSNQACIGKGLISQTAVDSINQEVIDSVISHGGRIDKIYTCADANPKSHFRKPNVGMAEQILSDYPNVDFSRTLVVGDSYSDELFAQRIGAFFINIQNI